MPAAAHSAAAPVRPPAPVPAPDPAPAELVATPRFAGVGSWIQRAPDGTVPPAAGAVQAPAGQVLVDDGAAVAPGRMTRGAFMAALRAQVTAACDQELAAVGRSAQDCPYIQQWLGYYEGRPASVIERAAQRYTGGAPKNAQELLGTIVGRVRSAVKLWATTGSVSGVPDAAASAAAAVGDFFGGLLQFKTEAGAAAPAAHPAAVRAQLGTGRSLEPGLRGRMEQGFGTSFSNVRVHTDSTASQLSRSLSARAFTVGQDVAFANGQYRPGTVEGDLLIAHELAHTLQQRGERGRAIGGEAAFEEDADQAAVAAVSLGTGVPRHRTGLRLQGCGDKKKAPEPTLLEKLKEINEPQSLLEALKAADPKELAELRKQVPSGSYLDTGIRWHLAKQAKNWRELSKLSTEKGAKGFVAVVGAEVVATILTGTTSIKIEGDDEKFRGWVATQLNELARLPVGFRLLVELLATGQPVQLKKSSTNAAQKPPGQADPHAGTLKILDDQGKLLPADQQRPGKPAGTLVNLNPEAAENAVTLGGTPQNPKMLDQSPELVVGHELIHALHRARGENIDVPSLINDPFTNDNTNPEEISTIKGQTRFPDQGQAFREPGVVITENMLRAERDLDPRSSHRGGRHHFAVATRKGETLEQLLGHYRVGGGAVSPGLRTELRAVILQWYPWLANGPVPDDFKLPLPHSDYMTLHLRAIRHNETLALEAESLEVR